MKHVPNLLLEDSPLNLIVLQLVQSNVLVVPEQAQVNAKVTRTSVIIILMTYAHQEVHNVQQELQNIHV